MKALGIVVLLAVGAALAQGIALLARAPALQLEQIEVSGNQRVSTEELVATMGVEPGTHLFQVSTTRTTARLEAIPWIRSARVERILPSKLRVLIVERTARMVVPTGAGPYLVDGDGLVLARGAEPLVQVLDLPVAELIPGRRIDQPAFDHARRAYDSLPEAVQARVASISASTVDQLKFNLNGGPTVFFGAAEELEAKNRAVEALLGELGGDPASGVTVDVRVPSRPVIRTE